jgi:hypothetical protein
MCYDLRMTRSKLTQRIRNLPFATGTDPSYVDLQTEVKTLNRLLQETTLKLVRANEFKVRVAEVISEIAQSALPPRSVDYGLGEPFLLDKMKELMRLYDIKRQLNEEEEQK